MAGITGEMEAADRSDPEGEKTSPGCCTEKKMARGKDHTSLSGGIVDTLVKDAVSWAYSHGTDGGKEL